MTIQRNICLGFHKTKSEVIMKIINDDQKLSDLVDNFCPFKTTKPWIWFRKYQNVIYEVRIMWSNRMVVERSGLKWIEADWSGLKWIEADWSELKWIEVNWSELKRIEVDWSEMKWSGMKRNEVEESGVRWIKVDWLELQLISVDWSKLKLIEVDYYYDGIKWNIKWNKGENVE